MAVILTVTFKILWTVEATSTFKLNNNCVNWNNCVYWSDVNEISNEFEVLNNNKALCKDLILNVKNAVNVYIEVDGQHFEQFL